MRFIGRAWGNWGLGLFLAFVVLATASVAYSEALARPDDLRSANVDLLADPWLPTGRATEASQKKHDSARAESSVHGDQEISIFHEIERSEYGFSELGEGSVSAPNRAQDLRIRVEESRLHVTPRIPGSENWVFSLRLETYGRLGSFIPLDDPRLQVQANRLELERTGITEWYVNDERGLKQGFTLFDRPSALGGDGPVILEMTLEGLIPNYIGNTDEQLVALVDETGDRILSYGDLQVWDALGIQQEASLNVLSDRLQILVWDFDATYPVTVDPVMKGRWIGSSYQAYAHFGWSVASAGDVNGDGYDDVIIGAPDFDINGADRGRIYVIHGAASGLEASPARIINGPQAGSRFGHAVASAGDLDSDGYDDVIVGVPGWTNGQTSEGRSYVYDGSSSGLRSTHSWYWESDVQGAQAGTSVASAGDVNHDGFLDLIVGAPDWIGEVDGIPAQGLAAVFHGPFPAITSSPDQIIFGVFGPQGLGWSVASAGDVNGDGYDDVIVGWPEENSDGLSNGQAQVWFGGPEFQDLWIYSDPMPFAHWGRSVASADVNGDGYSDVIIGASGWSSGGGLLMNGRVSVFYGSSSGLPASPSWTSVGGQDREWFGYSVASAGDVNGDGYEDVVIGATFYDPVRDGYTIPDGGRASIYFGSSAGLLGVGRTALGDRDGMRLGTSVASAGDVNGDGIGDVVLGAPWTTAPTQEEGSAYVYYGCTKSDLGGQSDAGARFSTARTISPGQYLGSLCLHDDDYYDYYKYYVTSGKELRFTMTPNPYANFDLKLYNPSDILRQSSLNALGQTDRVVLKADATGYWRTRVGVSNDILSEFRDYGFYDFGLKVWTPVILSSPSGSQIGENTVTVTWSMYDNADGDFSKYVVYYKRTSSSTWTHGPERTSPTQTSASVGGLSCAASYHFRVRVLYTDSRYYDSNTVTATTSDCSGGGGGGGGGKYFFLSLPHIIGYQPLPLHLVWPALASAALWLADSLLSRSQETRVANQNRPRE